MGPGARSDAVRAALVAARRMRRPAPLLMAMLARAGRVEADPLAELIDFHPSAGLVPLLARRVAAAAPRRARPAAALAGEAALGAAMAQAPDGATRPVAAGSGAAPVPGGSSPRERLALPGGAGETAPAGGAGAAGASAGGTVLGGRGPDLAAARDRLRRAARDGLEPLAAGPEPEGGASPGGSRERAWVEGVAAGGWRLGEATQEGGGRGAGVEGVAASVEAVGEAVVLAESEAALAKAVRAAARSETAASREGTGDGVRAAFPAVAAPREALAGGVTLRLEDGDAALREAAYRHGVDVT